MLTHICPGVPGIFSHLSEFSPFDLKNIAFHLKSTTCHLDSISTRLLKTIFHSVSPQILAIVNCLLSTGTFPSSLKYALVHPLMGKPTLDSSILDNFRPIPKIIEKSIAAQIFSNMNSNIFEQAQAFRFVQIQKQLSSGS